MLLFKPSECLELCLGHKQISLPLAARAAFKLLEQNDHMEGKFKGKNKLYRNETLSENCRQNLSAAETADKRTTA